MTMIWVAKHPEATIDMLGFLPQFLSDEDPRPAKEQIDANYSHGGGFMPMPGFELLPNGNLKYPGDPELPIIAESRLRDETIRFYEYAWLVIIQKDGSWEVARID